MKVVLPSNTSHVIYLIPRFYTYDDLVLNLYNESTKEETDITLLYGSSFNISDGYVSINFDHTFLEGDKYQLKITSDSDVVYRDKIFATEQTPQDYSQTSTQYYY